MRTVPAVGQPAARGTHVRRPLTRHPRADYTGSQHLAHDNLFADGNAEIRRALAAACAVPPTELIVARLSFSVVQFLGRSTILSSLVSF